MARRTSRNGHHLRVTPSLVINNTTRNEVSLSIALIYKESVVGGVVYKAPPSVLTAIFFTFRAGDEEDLVRDAEEPEPLYHPGDLTDLSDLFKEFFGEEVYEGDGVPSKERQIQEGELTEIIQQRTEEMVVNLIEDSFINLPSDDSDEVDGFVTKPETNTAKESPKRKKKRKEGTRGNSGSQREPARKKNQQTKRGRGLYASTYSTLLPYVFMEGQSQSHMAVKPFSHPLLYPPVWQHGLASLPRNQQYAGGYPQGERAWMSGMGRGNGREMHSIYRAQPQQHHHFLQQQTFPPTVDHRTTIRTNPALKNQLSVKIGPLVTGRTHIGINSAATRARALVRQEPATATVPPGACRSSAYAASDELSLAGTLRDFAAKLPPPLKGKPESACSASTCLDLGGGE